MTQKELNLTNKYDDFYPRNYHKNKSQEKDRKQHDDINTNANAMNKHSTYKEYIPKKRMLNNQQVHPLQKDKDSYYPKYQTKYYKEKYNRNEDIKEEKDIIEEEDEEDDYSGLAGNNYYMKNYKKSKFKNKIKYSEDKNDFKTKWKTEMCHYWEMYGFCKFGDACAFAHGSEELNKRKMSSNYKTKPCKQFFELGYCSYGVRCQFSHKLLKECNEPNLENRNIEKKEVSYLKILSDFNNSSNQISHEVLKRPRLMTFENIASCSLNETEKNRLELYGDILAVKKKENEEPEHVFSDDNTNDDNSESNAKYENIDKKYIDNINNIINDDNENETKKRERFISI
jgi:hypothetical protein